jgi:hypothetical protein
MTARDGVILSAAKDLLRTSGELPAEKALAKAPPDCYNMFNREQATLRRKDQSEQ